MAKKTRTPAAKPEDDSETQSLSREEYFDERKLLLEARQRGYQRAEQMVLGGATGALVLSITFLEKLVPAETVVRSAVLVAAWVTLILSLCLSLGGQYISACSFTGEIDRLEASLQGGPVSPNPWRRWNTVVSVAAAGTLAVGIILLAYFAYVNAPFNR